MYMCMYIQQYISLPRLWGERVNLREQHDAFEFFNCLVDSLDEGLKSFSYNPVLSEVLGGAFADQKICKGCPHRLERPQCNTVLACSGKSLNDSYSTIVALVPTLACIVCAYIHVHVQCTCTCIYDMHAHVNTMYMYIIMPFV